MAGKIRVLATFTSGDASSAGGLATHRDRVRRISEPFADLSVAELGGPATVPGRLTLAWQILRLWLTVRRQKPDAILVNTPMFPASCTKLGVMLMGLPGWARRRTSVFFHGGRLPPKPRAAAHFAGVRRFYFLSSLQKSQFEQAYPEVRATALYANYADGETVIPSRPHRDATQFLFVGRLIEEKGARDALLAFARLVELRPGLSARFTVCGDGPQSAHLRQEFSGLVERKLVTFTGHVEATGLSAFYAAADVLVFPTRYPEGFPYVLIEAFQHAVCVVASREGALADHVRHGENGFALETGEVQEITSCMDRLASDGALLERLRAGAAAHFAAHFTLAKGVAFYRSVLQAEHTPNVSAPSA